MNPIPNFCIESITLISSFYSVSWTTCELSIVFFESEIAINIIIREHEVMVNLSEVQFQFFSIFVTLFFMQRDGTGHPFLPHMSIYIYFFVFVQKLWQKLQCFTMAIHDNIEIFVFASLLFEAYNFFSVLFLIFFTYFF